jgi:hypothetical protein
MKKVLILNGSYHETGAVILSSGAPYPINILLGFTRYPKKILSLFCRFYGCANTVLLPAGGVGGSEKMRLSWGNKAYKGRTGRCDKSSSEAVTICHGLKLKVPD